MTNDAGLTQKEMLVLLLKGQEELHSRVNHLNEKLESRPSRQEITMWILVFGGMFTMINSVM